LSAPFNERKIEFLRSKKRGDIFNKIERISVEKEQKKSKLWIIIGGVIVLLIIILVLGCLAIGFRHIRGKGELKMLRGSRGMAMMSGKDFGAKMGFMGRGLSGQITAINGDNLTIKSQDGDEVTAVILDTTSIYNQGKVAKQADLKVNNSVIVVGRPNSSGIVQAQAIEIR
jgi:hypothetical protein